MNKKNLQQLVNYVINKKRKKESKEKKLVEILNL